MLRESIIQFHVCRLVFTVTTSLSGIALAAHLTVVQSIDYTKDCTALK
jgi:hypothetical protein